MISDALLDRLIIRALNEYQESFYALSRADLCCLTGGDDRQVRASVARLRREGHLIVIAEVGGYRVAESADEVRAYVEGLERRMVALQVTIAALKTAAAARFGGDDDGGV